LDGFDIFFILALVNKFFFKFHKYKNPENKHYGRWKLGMGIRMMRGKGIGV